MGLSDSEREQILDLNGVYLDLLAQREAMRKLLSTITRQLAGLDQLNARIHDTLQAAERIVAEHTDEPESDDFGTYFGPG